MARITPPMGYDNWDTYINEQADLSPDQSIEARRLIKRDIKLGMIAQIERQLSEPSYRQYNQYSSPGIYAPYEGRPFTIDPLYTTEVELALEDGSVLSTEDGDELIL